MRQPKLTDVNKRVPSGLKCSNCGKQFGKTYGWLKTHYHFVCDCGERTDWRPEKFVEIVEFITEERAKIINEARSMFNR